MRYCFDIDGTICSPTIGRDYHLAEPWYERIDIVNGLYDRGHYIIYFSARGMGRFGDDPDAPFKAEEILYDLTYDQLISWGCKFDQLRLGKPHADYFIDDKGWSDIGFFNDKLN